MKTVGIIGFGSFGEFVARSLDGVVRVKVSSRQPESVPKRWRATFEDVSQCDYIIPTIPLDAYQAVLTKLREAIRPDAVIVDVCSVKIKPMEIIRSILPYHRAVATHPLFGPESAAGSLAGHTFILCRDLSDAEAADQIALFAHGLGLEVYETTAEDHDRQMAVAHGLTFFIAQSLVDMHLDDIKLITPSFRTLLDLADLERKHTADLFLTIQQGNPYTAAVRRRFVDAVRKLEESL